MIADIFLYTATHGMSWQNPPRDSAEFLELDSCRKCFGRLPNFDCEERGFEGIKLSERFAYIVRCICAQQWDFRGRDSIYMIVARIPREDVCLLHITSLLSLSFFAVPTRTPPSSIDCSDFYGGDCLWHDEIMKIGIGTGAIRRDIGSQFFRVIRNACRQNESVRRSRPTGSRQQKPILRRTFRFSSTTQMWVASCVAAFITITLAFLFRFKVIGRKHRQELLANDGMELAFKFGEKAASPLTTLKPLDQVKPSFSKALKPERVLYGEKVGEDKPFYLYKRSGWCGFGEFPLLLYEYSFEYKSYRSGGF